jgi:hypothetical protein
MSELCLFAAWSFAVEGFLEEEGARGDAVDGCVPEFFAIPE